MKGIINEIKLHEKRYTIILVIFFLIIFIFGGYLILSIDNKKINNYNTTNYRYSSISNSNQAITLTIIIL